MTLGEFRKLTQTYPDEIPIVMGDMMFPTAFEFLWNHRDNMPIIGIRGRIADDEFGTAPWQVALSEMDKEQSASECSSN